MVSRVEPEKALYSWVLKYADSIPFNDCDFSLVVDFAKIQQNKILL